MIMRMGVPVRGLSLRAKGLLRLRLVRVLPSRPPSYAAAFLLLMRCFLLVRILVAVPIRMRLAAGLIQVALMILLLVLLVPELCRILTLQIRQIQNCAAGSRFPPVM